MNHRAVSLSALGACAASALVVTIVLINRAGDSDVAPVARPLSGSRGGAESSTSSGPSRAAPADDTARQEERQVRLGNVRSDNGFSVNQRADVPASIAGASTIAGIVTLPVSPAKERDPGPTRLPEEDEVSARRVMTCHLDDRGALGAADALQACLDRAPAFSSVEIPPGTWLLDRQVVVSVPVTIRTAGSGGTSLSCVAEPDRCAVLTSAPNLLAPFGFLLIRSTSHVMLEHLVLDGNRGQRLTSVAAQNCQSGRNTAGFNAAVLSCLRCALDDLVSRNALCGTGMVWSGAQASIQQSEFRNNGDAGTALMWADGLTLVYAPDSDVRQNRFVDNSDIGLIIGHGARSRIDQNLVVQRTQPAFAGLMLNNFNSSNLSVQGDFRGAVIANNTIDCGAQLCVFGIQVGPRPWYPSPNIVGGDVHGNDVRGAKVGINVDGGGVRLAPIAIFANSVSDVPAGAWFSGCASPIPTAWMNVAPTSFVDRRGDLVATDMRLSDQCQLSSALASVP